jgi:hypothetical protein
MTINNNKASKAMPAKKRKQSICLPELQGVSAIQPTRITNGSYPYNLLHQKIFTFIIYELQEHIRMVANGTKILQLDCFNNNQEHIAVQIPMQYIGRASQYPIIRRETEQMCKILVTIPDFDKTKRKVSGLISQVISLEHGKRSNLLSLEIRKDVAQLLMEIEYNHVYKKPVNYTQFLIGVVHQCKNKYTPQLYKLISSWKVKGGFQIPLQELKDRLGIPADKYPNFAHFKKSVLIPVSEELKEFGDCWYNCAEHDFIVTDGAKKVTNINFKVISHSREKINAMQLQNCKEYLKNIFDFTQGYMDLLEPLFTSGIAPLLILDKGRDIAYRIAQNPAAYPKVQAYAKTSLLAMLKNTAPDS